MAHGQLGAAFRDTLAVLVSQQHVDFVCQSIDGDGGVGTDWQVDRKGLERDGFLERVEVDLDDECVGARLHEGWDVGVIVVEREDDIGLLQQWAGVIALVQRVIGWEVSTVAPLHDRQRQQLCQSHQSVIPGLRPATVGGQDERALALDQPSGRFAQRAGVTGTESGRWEPLRAMEGHFPD